MWTIYKNVIFYKHQLHQLKASETNMILGSDIINYLLWCCHLLANFRTKNIVQKLNMYSRKFTELWFSYMKQEAILTIRIYLNIHRLSLLTEMKHQKSFRKKHSSTYSTYFQDNIQDINLIWSNVEYMFKNKRRMPCQHLILLRVHYHWMLLPIKILFYVIVFTKWFLVLE